MSAPEIRVSTLVRSPVSATTVRRLASDVVRREKADLLSLSITFVGPARMRTLNREHLDKDRETDVIAFAFRPSGPSRPSRPSLVGDIYICPALAARAAKEHGTTLKDEVRRLVVHGVLHVLGYDHPEGAGRTKSAMWKVQERYLAGPGAG